MPKQYDPSPVQLCLALDAPKPSTESLKYMGKVLVFDCPPPQRFGQDQYRCTRCGVVWDVDEPVPPCQDIYRYRMGQNPDETLTP